MTRRRLAKGDDTLVLGDLLVLVELCDVVDVVCKLFGNDSLSTFRWDSLSSLLIELKR